LTSPSPAGRSRLRLAAALALILGGGVASAQQLDLTHGGPIDISAKEGIEWRQADQQVIARGDARAIRGAVTVTADRLTAWYRKKGNGTDPQPPPPPSGLAADTSSEGNEIYRLQAEGRVRIYTQTDVAQGDRATYDLDQAVLVMTGRNLKLTTPNDVITARDDLEYWPRKRMAVARGDAIVVTNDAKRVAADTLVAYTEEGAPPGGPTPAAMSTRGAAGTAATATPAAAGPGAKPTDDPLASSGKLQRVEAFGHVSVRTATETVTGDRAVYVPDTGMARVGGNVQITRGQNQLNGAEADVNMKTGIAKLLATNAGRVHGLVLPNDETSKSLTQDPTATPTNGKSTGTPGHPSPGSPAGATPGQKP
jgi:lipopolysaccharide export system protein LptA